MGEAYVCILIPDVQISTFLIVKGDEQTVTPHYIVCKKQTLYNTSYLLMFILENF